MHGKLTIKQILSDKRPLWDNEQNRPVVRKVFQAMLDCRTMALGAEVYASDNGERKIFPHTCGSRACSSCGHRAMLCWKREIEPRLPDIPYAGVLITIPGVFWLIFQQNRHLLDDLAAIGAAALEEWAQRKYGAKIMALVVLHTFGSDLKFYPHLHVLVSTVGLHETGNRLVSNIRFFKDAIKEIWQRALLDYLTMALKDGRLATDRPHSELLELFENHRGRWWKTGVSYLVSKTSFVGYISRYMLRPPLAERRLLSYDGQYVSFLAKDEEGQEVPTTLPVADFIARLADQVPDRYRHGVRFFGLLAPRSIGKSTAVFWALLGQRRPARPRRIGWAELKWRTFGKDPLLDSDGRRMHWVGRVPPARHGPT